MGAENYRPEQTSAGPDNPHVVGQITFRNIDLGGRPENAIFIEAPRIDGYVGIDPGATGAIALLDETGNFLSVDDYPEGPVGLWFLLNKFRNVQVRLAVLEQVHSMPKQGVSSSFKFGSNFGIWQMACAAMGWPMELITPQRWRKILDSSVPLKATKEDLRQYALRRWPAATDYLQRKGDHGRAEAMIMAMYARLKFLGEAK